MEPSDTEEGRLTSYARVSLDLKDDEGKSKRQTAYISIRSIQKDGHYIVDRPISMISTAPAAMNEDMKKDWRQKKKISRSGLYGTGEAGDHEYDPVVLYDLCR